MAGKNPKKLYHGKSCRAEMEEDSGKENLGRILHSGELGKNVGIWAKTLFILAGCLVQNFKWIREKKDILSSVQRYTYFYD